MTSATDLAFPRVGALVDLAERRGGSRMNAYSDVARRIGASASWVRKFLGRQPIRLDADTFLNIQAAYRAECGRYEAEAAKEWARLRALKEGDDAMAAGARGSLDGSAGGRLSPEAGARAVVAPVVDEGAK